jgi:hypothetical protein
LPSISAQEVALKLHQSKTKQYLSSGIFSLSSQVNRINQNLDEDFAAKALHDQVVGPFSKINGLVFIPTEKSDHELEMTLIDANTQEKFALTQTQSMKEIL